MLEGWTMPNDFFFFNLGGQCVMLYIIQSVAEPLLCEGVQVNPLDLNLYTYKSTFSQVEPPQYFPLNQCFYSVPSKRGAMLLLCFCFLWYHHIILLPLLLEQKWNGSHVNLLLVKCNISNWHIIWLYLWKVITCMHDFR